jgi:hypothetical protein
MTDEAPKLKLTRLFLGLAAALFVAVLVLAVGTLIILGTRTDAYLNLEQSMERFIGG